MGSFFSSPDSDAEPSPPNTQSDNPIPSQQKEVETPSPSDQVTSDPKAQEKEKEEEEEEEEEEGECGFCLYMKGGGCKDAFVEWEKCLDESNKKNEDITEKCFEATAQLKKCMDAHAEYYEPILRAEKAMEESATAEGGQELKEEDATIEVEEVDVESVPESKS